MNNKPFETKVCLLEPGDVTADYTVLEPLRTDSEGLHATVRYADGGRGERDWPIHRRNYPVTIVDIDLDIRLEHGLPCGHI